MKIKPDWSLESAWSREAVNLHGRVTEQPDGLQTLREVLIAIEAGLPLRGSAAAHLQAAFHAYLHEGKHDLTANLGLRPGRGRSHEAPLRLERLTRRDAYIKQALERLGGNKPEAREMLAELLSTDHLVLPTCFAFAEPVMLARQEAGGSVSISARQIARIVSDQPAYRRKRES